MSIVVARVRVRLRPPSLKVDTLSVPIRNQRIAGRHALLFDLRVIALSVLGLRLVLLGGRSASSGERSLCGEAMPWFSSRGVGSEARNGDTAAVGAAGLNEGVPRERDLSCGGGHGCACGRYRRSGRGGDAQEHIDGLAFAR